MLAMLKQFRQQQRELRPNMRFLRNTVQSVDRHNRTLLERESRESSNRMQERETRQRDITPTAASTTSPYTKKESHRRRSTRHTTEDQQPIHHTTTSTNPPPHRSRQHHHTNNLRPKRCRSPLSSTSPTESNDSRSSSHVEIGPMPVKGRGTVTAPR